ncbi:unnamed protein product [Absidia cylindrospora]
MIQPFIWLLVLCITMLIGSFLFGCIPLSVKLSGTKLRQMAAIGVGLLIGTSLVVIIPEGVETLYSSPTVPPASHHDTIPSAQPPLFIEILTTPTTTTYFPTDSLPWTTPTPPIDNPHLIKTNDAVHPLTDHDSGTNPKHTSVGLALIIGFGLMFIIDQYSSLHVHGSSSTTTTTETMTVNLHHDPLLDDMLTTLEKPGQSGIGAPTVRCNDNGGTGTTAIRQVAATATMTPMIGVVVHAVADGIALGASANQPQLSMVVFFAIMLHKGPSAFALTTVLLAEGLSRTQVRKHLLLFSMAAPSGALSTFLLLSLMSVDDLVLTYWTGVLLVFSGGTFLYVAMHALQELQQLGHSLDKSHAGCILFGMLLPVFLNLGHSH